ncbi:hypothetical protein HYP07_gp066 [Vibrio phage JSF3]|uniref:Uncharacterized protein n=2 Tax=Pacinivirus VCO139 TaxID=2846607 RepID=R9R4G3_9CAUD|nr:hypothetical protein M612_gp74 [Vibrio phage JA-1]YP_009874331.1 hypothetical protein HYO77_gp74 [Vibrio phage VCO139]YP_009876291.1 hypothetical protein HYP07_gp066 [Vibrio phage JSF3]UYF10814.1 hypothetical protein 12VC501_gene0013 [Vibrio phage 12VC501]AGI61782.1 hypothetical protein JA1_0029 [Vibrio phage JA-1]AGI61859.1 hypothetical protein VCO139_0029 [Vibrio phage VCO139]APD18078.1 hypothetical protein [Vibrio phage JSF3]
MYFNVEYSKHANGFVPSCVDMNKLARRFNQETKKLLSEANVKTKVFIRKRPAKDYFPIIT